jgi:hypothetical protein
MNICIILGGQGIAEFENPWPMGLLKDGRKKKGGEEQKIVENVKEEGWRRK